MSQFAPLLDRRHLMFLRATMGSGATAAEAYGDWRASEKFDDTGDLAYRLMPLLAATAEAAGLQDEDSRRMRGVVKHIWLSNMVRIRDLIEAKQALERADIPVLVFKGGALFARDPQFAAMRAAGDYDLLVRRKDALRAVDTLRQAGFHSLGMHIELFAQADFDGDTHAVAMSKSDASKAIDLHWRAISQVRDERFVEDLFANAEVGKLFGHEVRIPGLAEHLLVAAIRPEPWDQKECLLRVIEIVQLLRNCRGQLDWQRFETLVARYRGGWIAAPLLALAREEANAPVPAGTIDRLWRSAAPAQSLELFVRGISREDRTVWQNMVLAAIDSLRSQFGRPFSWSSVLARPSMLSAMIEDCARHWPYSGNWLLRRLWGRYVRRDDAPVDDVICFQEGFSVPELQGRWTDKEYAVIEASIDAADDRVVRLTLDVVPFLPAGTDSMRVHLYAGGGKPIQVTVGREHPMPFRMEIEAAVVGTPGKVVLVLRAPHRVRPRDIGLSVDHRLLGLFVRSVRVGDRLVFNPAAAAV